MRQNLPIGMDILPYIINVKEGLNMRFYEISGTIRSIEIKTAGSRNDDSMTASEYIETPNFRYEAQFVNEEFNDAHNKDSLLCIARMSTKEITFCAMVQGECDLLKKCDEYLNRLGIRTKRLSVSEVTFSEFVHLLRHADRRDYIRDEAKILLRFNLYILSRKIGTFGFDEEIKALCTDREMLRECNKLLTCDDLKAEMKRIKSPNGSDSIHGHPVHYLIEADDEETKNITCDLLLNSLLKAGRVNSRRINMLDCKHLSRSEIDMAFNICAQSTLIVSLGDINDPDGEYMNNSLDALETLCSNIKANRNEVLTIIKLPKECSRLKSYILDSLGALSFIEITERPADSKRAKRIWKDMAKNSGVEPDEQLLSRAEPNETYLTAELRAIFEEWFSKKLRTDIYPQYKDFSAARTNSLKEGPKGSAYDELMSMVGLSEAKQLISQAVNFHKVQKFLSSKDMTRERPVMHMAFTGSPGTAKTTVARLFAKIMRENELLSSGHMVEVGRGDLVGKYVGHTAPLVQNAFKRAKGGVLFIDEAYSLVDDKEGMFGDEAINTIVQEMENNRDNVVVIFAGYQYEMERFLERNPGLNSRVPFHIPFSDYSAEELCEIAELTATKKGMRLSADADEKLLGIFKAACGEKRFGNGRFVRNAVEKAMLFQASRLVDEDIEALPKSELVTLTAKDFEGIRAKTQEQQCSIGFCA